MGIEVALIAGLVIGAAGQVKAGIDAKKESNEQARAILEETNVAMGLKEDEITRFTGEQQAAFTKSGVDLSQSGSAMDVLEFTRTEGDKQIAEIQRQGKAQAAAVKRQGRNALIGSIAGAASSTLTGISGFYGAKGK